MKITAKGQVTIPRRLRRKFGLLPHTEVTVEEAAGYVVIRPALRKQALVQKRLRDARGVAADGTSTGDVMRLTRGEG